MRCSGVCSCLLLDFGWWAIIALYCTRFEFLRAFRNRALRALHLGRSRIGRRGRSAQRVTQAAPLAGTCMATRSHRLRMERLRGSLPLPICASPRCTVAAYCAARVCTVLCNICDYAKQRTLSHEFQSLHSLVVCVASHMTCFSAEILAATPRFGVFLSAHCCL